jgi:drug/metabolite transporter (DMT)-like permease
LLIRKEIILIIYKDYQNGRFNNNSDLLKKIMATSKYAILGMIICTILIAFGQVFLKMAADSFKFSFNDIIGNYYIFIALFLYGLGLIVMILSFKYGEISVLYPLLALSFIWVFILSTIILGETLNWFKISAILFIVIGIVLITRGRSK